MDALLFLTFAAIAVLCAINLVLQTHPISSALSLVGVMGSLAVLYLLLGGAFIAAVQLIVYAGAVMVLFLFVIMLLGGQQAGSGPDLPWQRPVSVVLAVALVALMAYALLAGGRGPLKRSPPANRFPIFPSLTWPDAWPLRMAPNAPKQ